MRVVVIPARDEESTIAPLVRSALMHAEVVIVADDSSSDRTADFAAAAGAIVLPVPNSRPGLPGVYRAGLAEALRIGGRQIAELDAGGSHDPGALPRFWGALEDGAGVAFGARFSLPGARYSGVRSRELLSRGGTWLVNFLYGGGWADATSGFVAYGSEALERLLAFPLRARGHFYQTEVRLLVDALRIPRTEVPIEYVSSGSSLRIGSILEALTLLLGSNGAIR